MLGGTSGSQRKGRDPSPPSTSWDLAPPGMLSWAEKPQAALWPFGLCPFMAGIAGHAQGAWQPSGPQEPLQSANGGRGDWEGSTVEIKVPEQECGGLEGPQCPSLLPGPGLPCHPDRDPDPLHAAGQPGRAGPGEQPLSSSFRQSLGSFWLLVWPQLPCPVSGYRALHAALGPEGAGRGGHSREGFRPHGCSASLPLTLSTVPGRAVLGQLG